MLGEWHLERRVADRRTPSYGRATGTATFAPDGEAVVWRERGTWTKAGRSHLFTRTYRIDAGWVLFDDGRPFHPWVPGDWVEHLCGEDTYRGLVDVTPARIRTLWDVSGPAKDHRIVTRLTPVWQSGQP